jgi:hypothetical protein
MLSRGMQHLVDWKAKARERLSREALEKRAEENDDDAITEAFAQQAHTAMGNRCRAIMRDPYLLGFEKIDGNEDNSRIVGAFAFRVNDEILLAPVFYLNGQIKGQNLLYRKGVNRFCPNKDKWISYLLSRGEDEEGRVVERNNQEAKINLHLDRITQSPLKFASVDDAEDQVFEFRRWLKTAALGQGLKWGIGGLMTGAAAGGTGGYMLRDHMAGKDDTEALKEIENLMAQQRKHFEEQMQGAEASKPEIKPEDAATLGSYLKNPWVVGALAAGAGAGLYGWGHLKQKREEEERMKRLGQALPKEASENLCGLLEFVTNIRMPKVKRAAVLDAMGWPHDEQGFVGLQDLLDHNSISDMWKEAKAAWQVTEPRHLFADFLVDAQLQKEAAELVERVPEFGELIAANGLLDHLTPRQAPSVSLELSFEPPSSKEASEQAVAGFYKRGYALHDSRSISEVAQAIQTEEPNALYSDQVEVGAKKVLDTEGNSHLAVVAPVFEARHPDRDYPMPYPGETDRPRIRTLLLESPHRGCVLDSENPPMCEEGDCPAMPESQTPKAGKRYFLFVPGLGFFSQAIDVEGVKTKGDVTTVDCPDYGAPRQLIVRRDVEKTTRQDFASRHGEPWVVAGDVQFLEIRKDEEGICLGCPPKGIKLLTRDEVQKSLMKAGGARVSIRRTRTGARIELNGRTVREDLSRVKLACHLARDLRLPGELSTEIAESPDDLHFLVYTPGHAAKAWPEKAASGFYYDRDLDPEVDFSDIDFDGDLQIPVDQATKQRIALAIRHQRTMPPRQWLDAKGTGGARNAPAPPSHIPDEVILQMMNPAMEMAQLGEQLGLRTLLDHGAVGAMTKVFDASSYVRDYVDKLEASLDYLARLIFMVYWKPKDFVSLYGDDDLTNIENKLNGVFESYGDLVLELLQNTKKER